MKKSWPWWLLAGGAALFLLKGTGDKRKAISDWVKTNAGMTDTIIVDHVLNQMSQGEIDTLYDFIFNYVAKNKEYPVEKSPVIVRIMDKYAIPVVWIT